MPMLDPCSINFGISQKSNDLLTANRFCANHPYVDRGKNSRIRSLNSAAVCSQITLVQTLKSEAEAPANAKAPPMQDRSRLATDNYQPTLFNPNSLCLLAESRTAGK
jgi:hypothetical protein